MREIKFDYIVKDIGPDNGNYLHLPYSLNQIEDSTKLSRMETDGRVVAKRQYTGLKDKNGVEIYEGDITKHDITGNLLTVEWTKNVFTSGFDIPGDSLLISHHEVIGNIYENKELLK